MNHRVIPRIKKIYADKKWPNAFNTIPEWLVVRYKDGKLVYVERYNDCPTENTIEQRLAAAAKD